MLKKAAAAGEKLAIQGYRSLTLKVQTGFLHRVALNIPLSLFFLALLLILSVYTTKLHTLHVIFRKNDTILQILHD